MIAARTASSGELIRAVCSTIAKSKNRVAYSAIDHLVGLNVSAIPRDRGVFGIILARIGAEERRNKRPFLPAVVVRKHSRRPGPGFYAEVRHRYPKYRRIAKNTVLHDAVLKDVYRYPWP